MSGWRYIYISSDNKVFKVPKPKEFVFKAVKELAGQDVYMVTFAFETIDRKPSRLFYVDFQQIRLDAEGVYAYAVNNEEVMLAMHNKFHFFSTPEDIAKRNGPIVLPIAPNVPSTKEKTVLYNYLNDRFPILGKDAPMIVEKRIKRLQDLHQERINMIKEANKIRNSN